MLPRVGTPAPPGARRGGRLRTGGQGAPPSASAAATLLQPCELCHAGATSAVSFVFRPIKVGGKKKTTKQTIPKHHFPFAEEEEGKEAFDILQIVLQIIFPAPLCQVSLLASILDL